MQISVSDAKARLSELVRRAKAGDDVVLTRHGQPEVRLVAVKRLPDRETRRKLIAEVQASAATNATPGEPAARSQDFLYDEQGLPR
jgi:prevent-host-death family protein